jgi:hypothetical protein
MLVAPTTSTSQTLCTKPAVVFAVLLLLALQFTSATHQFDHNASELGDVCSFCLQLDRLDDISAAESVEFTVSSAHSGNLEFTAPLTHVKRQVFSQPRAPPLS